MEPKKLRIQTDTGADVTEIIEKGKTHFFTEKPDAIKLADQKRSYQYPLYNQNREHIGYGVPN